MAAALDAISSTLQCEILQREEYEVLESIYPECVSSKFADKSLRLEIPVEFDGPRAVHVVQDESLTTSDAPEPNSQIILSLSSLPSLMINAILPASYPLESPPTLTSVRASHLWLPHICRLQDSLIEMWQPGEGVLYTWIEYLRNGEFLQSHSLTSLDDHKQIIRLPHPSPRILAKLLEDSDASATSLRFSQNSYPCSICLSSFKGSKCVLLSCAHVFCRTCLEDFWSLCIAEGEVGRVGCPDPACVKANREADAEEVARVVTETEVDRWRWLREKRNLERDPSIVHCPMAFCQTPVPKPAEVDGGSGYDRLRSCPACSFSFCAFCRRTWHGPITACPIAHSEKLILEYLNLPEGSAERQFIEKRFGRANVLKLVAHYEEEQANKEWLQASTMACPGCEVHVEKSLGCNHMTCVKCRQHFCYRCGAKLPADDAYTHFSTVGHRCYNKLFDFQEVEE